MLRQLVKLKQTNTSMTIGMVLHGGTIMSLLSIFYGGEYFDYQIANAQGYICTLKETHGYPQMVDVQKIR